MAKIIQCTTSDLSHRRKTSLREWKGTLLSTIHLVILQNSQMFEKSYLLTTQWGRTRVNRAQVNTYTYNISSSYSAYFNFRQEVSIAAIWRCNASGRFFIGALRLCKRPSTRVRVCVRACVCVCVCVCMCATKSGIVDRVENVPWQRSARVRGHPQKVLGWKLAPLRRPATPFQRTLPTNTLCLARAPT